MSEFDDAWLRFDRAKRGPHRLKAVRTKWRADNPDAYTATVKRDGHGKARLDYHINKRPPKEWGLLVGDVLEDLRACLDYAVFALATAHGPKPLPRPELVEFPIARPDDPLKKRAIEHIPDGAKDLIKSLQPENMFGKESAFYLLNELVRIHKHRSVALTWAAFAGFGLSFKGSRDVEFYDLVIEGPVGSLENAKISAEWHERIIGPNPKIQVNPSLKIDLAFAPTEHTPLYSVTRLLPNLIINIGNAVSDLERYV